MNWIPLESLEGIEEIKKRSTTKEVVIFKHSTRCFISKMVKSKFERKVSNSNSDAEFYHLDLIKFRAISNEIASTFNIVHQSPQVLVIKNEEAVTSASHYDIITDINF